MSDPTSRYAVSRLREIGVEGNDSCLSGTELCQKYQQSRAIQLVEPDMSSAAVGIEDSTRVLEISKKNVGFSARHII